MLDLQPCTGSVLTILPWLEKDPATAGIFPISLFSRALFAYSAFPKLKNRRERKDAGLKSERW